MKRMHGVILAMAAVALLLPLSSSAVHNAGCPVVGGTTACRTLRCRRRSGSGATIPK